MADVRFAIEVFEGGEWVRNFPLTQDSVRESIADMWMRHEREFAAAEGQTREYRKVEVPA